MNHTLWFGDVWRGDGCASTTERTAQQLQGANASSVPARIEESPATGSGLAAHPASVTGICARVTITGLSWVFAALTPPRAEALQRLLAAQLTFVETDAEKVLERLTYDRAGSDPEVLHHLAAVDLGADLGELLLLREDRRASRARPCGPAAPAHDAGCGSCSHSAPAR